MKYTFSTKGKIIYGLPYVAKVSLDIDRNLKKDFIENKADISIDGEVFVMCSYEAENYEIIEERYGSCGQDELATYSLAYRNKLITLGYVGDTHLENRIKLFLDEELQVHELLTEIDELIKEQFKTEIDEIFNLSETKTITERKGYIDIIQAITEFIKANEYIKVKFNDYHIIFNTDNEKIKIKFANDENIYIETETFKLNIRIDKIQDYDVINDKLKFEKITLTMKDGAIISLVSE